MDLKVFCHIFGAMSEEAFCMLSGTLKTVCVMLLCSLAILKEIGPPGPDTYRLFYLASQLESNAFGVLLIGNFAALFLERFQRR